MFLFDRLPRKYNTPRFMQNPPCLSLVHHKQTPSYIIQNNSTSIEKEMRTLLMEKVLTLLQPRNIKIALLRYLRELKR